MPTDTHVGAYGYARRPQGNEAAETASTQNRKLIDISIGNGVDVAEEQRQHTESQKTPSIPDPHQHWLAFSP